MLASDIPSMGVLATGKLAIYTTQILKDLACGYVDTADLARFGQPISPPVSC